MTSLSPTAKKSFDTVAGFTSVATTGLICALMQTPANAVTVITSESAFGTTYVLNDLDCDYSSPECQFEQARVGPITITHAAGGLITQGPDGLGGTEGTTPRFFRPDDPLLVELDAPSDHFEELGFIRSAIPLDSDITYTFSFEGEEIGTVTDVADFQFDPVFAFSFSEFADQGPFDSFRLDIDEPGFGVGGIAIDANIPDTVSSVPLPGSGSFLVGAVAGFLYWRQRRQSTLG